MGRSGRGDGENPGMRSIGPIPGFSVGTGREPLPHGRLTDSIATVVIVYRGILGSDLSYVMRVDRVDAVDAFWDG